MYLVVNSMKSHRACFMAFLDINSLSKVEMELLNGVSSNALIYDLTSYVNKMLIVSQLLLVKLLSY